MTAKIGSSRSWIISVKAEIHGRIDKSVIFRPVPSLFRNACPNRIDWGKYNVDISFVGHFTRLTSV